MTVGPMPPCKECGMLSPFHHFACKMLPPRQDVVDVLRDEVKQLTGKLESANQLNADMNKQRQEMIRRAYDAELQLSAIKAAIGLQSCGCSQLIEEILAALPQGSENRLSVEGKPGDVCGPCGVAHPVAEKRIDLCDAPPSLACGTGAKRCMLPKGHKEDWHWSRRGDGEAAFDSVWRD
jgi:hypothetical protein